MSVKSIDKFVEFSISGSNANVSWGNILEKPEYFPPNSVGSGILPANSSGFIVSSVPISGASHVEWLVGIRRQNNLKTYKIYAVGAGNDFNYAIESTPDIGNVSDVVFEVGIIDEKISLIAENAGPHEWFIKFNKVVL